MKRVLIHIYISPKIKEKLQKLAEKQGRSISDIVREGIAYVIKKYEEEEVER